ncbi:MAG: DUF2791 family P-loop domain-containing protein [Chloroflexi bacterium]|nr:DUF2791 family P-loop domain-containing protein [Chloroflexota bacterium]
MEVAPLELLAHLAAMGTPPDDGTAVLRVSAGLQRSLERVERETLPFIAAGGGEIQFVFGPYGRGKTHFLKALAQWASERGCVTAYVDCQRPFESLVETYRAIASGMVPPGRHNFFATTGITRTIEACFTGLDATGQRMVIERLKADQALSPDFRNLVVAYCTEGVAGSGDEDLVDELEALLASTPTFRVTLGKLYRRHPSLPRPLGKLARRNAAVWLRSLLSLPQVLGYNGLVVLFDETEASLRSRRTPILSRRQQAHLAHIRTFVDHMAIGAFRGCAIYYAVTEEFIEIAGRNLEALSQRIERVRMPELDGAPNQRAVWVNIDELTNPSPQDPLFYSDLGNRIIDIGREAGLRSSDVRDASELLADVGEEYANSITEGRVRDFVKEAAALVAENVPPAVSQEKPK